MGQKNKEFFYERSEKLISFRKDERIKKIYLYKNSNSKIYFNIFRKSKTVKDIYEGFKKIFVKSTHNMNEIKKIYLKNII